MNFPPCLLLQNISNLPPKGFELLFPRVSCLIPVIRMVHFYWTNSHDHSTFHTFSGYCIHALKSLHVLEVCMNRLRSPSCPLTYLPTVLLITANNCPLSTKQNGIVLQLFSHRNSMLLSLIWRTYLPTRQSLTGSDIFDVNSNKIQFA